MSHEYSAEQTVTNEARAEKFDADGRAWLTAIAQGDEAALAAFYDATLNKVYGLALRITGKQESAEDVVSDVYLQVWREAGRYDTQRGRVITWLLTICRSRALDYLRKHRKFETNEEFGASDVEPEANGHGPSDLLLALERDSAVHLALKELTSTQRQLVALAFFKDMSHQQIAQHMKLPLGTVKTHIRKGLSELKLTLMTIEPETRQ